MDMKRLRRPCLDEAREEDGGVSIDYAVLLT